MDGTEEVLRLEERLLGLGKECDRVCVEALLADNFMEFGASGRVWKRAELIAALDGHGARKYVIERVESRSLGPEAVLLTYHVCVDGRLSLRSSVWQRINGYWRMTFHQGTPVPSTV